MGDSHVTLLDRVSPIPAVRLVGLWSAGDFVAFRLDADAVTAVVDVGWEGFPCVEVPSWLSPPFHPCCFRSLSCSASSSEDALLLDRSFELPGFVGLLRQLSTVRAVFAPLSRAN